MEEIEWISEKEAFVVLSIYRSDEDVHNINEIRDMVDSTTAYVIHVVNFLEKDGIVETKVRDSDRRNRDVRLTPAGRGLASLIANTDTFLMELRRNDNE